MAKELNLRISLALAAMLRDDGLPAVPQPRQLIAVSEEPEHGDDASHLEPD